MLVKKSISVNLFLKSPETHSNSILRVGPVVRLSPVDYSIADLDVAKQIYGPRTAYEKVNIDTPQIARFHSTSR